MRNRIDDSFKHCRHVKLRSVYPSRIFESCNPHIFSHKMTSFINLPIQRPYYISGVQLIGRFTRIDLYSTIRNSLYKSIR